MAFTDYFVANIRWREPGALRSQHAACLLISAENDVLAGTLAMSAWSEETGLPASFIRSFRVNQVELPTRNAVVKLTEVELK